jgi:hypothetical protein
MVLQALPPTDTLAPVTEKVGMMDDAPLATTHIRDETETLVEKDDDDVHTVPNGEPDKVEDAGPPLQSTESEQPVPAIPPADPTSDRAAEQAAFIENVCASIVHSVCTPPNMHIHQLFSKVEAESERRAEEEERANQLAAAAELAVIAQAAETAQSTPASAAAPPRNGRRRGGSVSVSRFGEVGPLSTMWRALTDSVP